MHFFANQGHEYSKNTQPLELKYYLLTILIWFIIETSKMAAKMAVMK